MKKLAARLDKDVAAAFTATLDAAADYSPQPTDLTGPTGESNRLSLHGRGVILCAGEDAVRLAALALLTGNAVLLADVSASLAALVTEMSKEKGLSGLVTRLDAALTPALAQEMPHLAALALTPGQYDLGAYRRALAGRDGAIVPLIVGAEMWEPYVAERALCIDTTASGGNTRLLAANEA